MSKITDFLADKRNAILAFMLILCVACAFMIPSVSVNQDLTKYLPDDSPMKSGLEIMKNEFPALPAMGSIRVMFTDLKPEMIPKIKEKLSGMENVSSVLYDDSEKYNSSPYTLFEVNCIFPYNTPEELLLEKEIAASFSSEKMILQHTDAMITGIPVWVFVVVVLVLMIILFAMCSSYVEPFLFLFTIGAAICINSGSNIMFDSISQTTFTLSAILQLVLSMDYSVILMNRYRQAKKKITEPVSAMKEALKTAFPSIVSSGMTTVLGLIMLVFMRFKIGLDIGRVMAKGVALSMICVLTVLPALILMFDKWITKTKKKELHIPTKSVAHFSFKGRRVLAIFFVILFAGTAVLQNMTAITFAPPKFNDIENVFPAANPMVVLYSNEDEEYMPELIQNVEQEKCVNMVMAYDNTLGKQMTESEMKTAVSAMLPENSTYSGAISPAVDVLFYHYYQKDNLPVLNISQFLNFVSDELIQNDLAKEQLTSDQIAMLDSVKNIASKEFLTSPQSAKTMSQLLGREETEMALVYSAFYGADPEYAPFPMPLHSFVSFLKDQVVSNPLLAGNMDAAMVSGLDMLLPMTDKEVISAQHTPNELAAMFNLNKEDIQKLFFFKFGAKAMNSTMSMAEFADFLLKTVAKNPMMEAMLNDEVKMQLNLMKNMMAYTLSDASLTFEEAASLFGLPSGDVKLLYAYHDYILNPDSFKISPEKLVIFLSNVIVKDERFTAMVDEKTASMLMNAEDFIQAVIKGNSLSSQEMYHLVSSFMGDKMDRKKMDLVYYIYGSKHMKDDTWTLSIEQMIGYLENTMLKDERFSAFLTDEIKASVHTAGAEIEKGLASLKGGEHSLMVINTSLPAESKETTQFVRQLRSTLAESFKGDYYLIGNSPMNVEMEENFGRDMMLITILTAAAIFLVVAFTFRSISIPSVLVLLVQCGVFITVAFSGLMGRSIYYLSMLIVQCILMGATIDYGIVFTNYYVDNRKKYDIAKSLIVTFEESIHTILTSSMIIAIITGIIGIAPADPAFTEICQTLSMGAISAVLLIIFILPGILAALDKWITKQKKNQKNT